MSQKLSLEQMIAGWMADEATGGSPDQVVDLTLATTSRTRPLPRWLAVIQASPMRAQTRTVVGVPTRQLALVAALALIAAAVVVGVAAALLLRPEPTADTWPGHRGDAARNGLAGHGPIGNPIVKWRFEAGGGVRSNIAVGGNLVLAPSDDGTLHALSIDDGVEQWRFTGARPMLGPFVTDGRVYVADGDGIIRALALNDGNPIWAADPLEGTSDITVVGGRLFVGTRTGDVVALDTSTGAEAWRTTVSPGTQAVHAPAATDAVVVAATDDNVLVALDPETGAIRWNAPTGDALTGTPVVANGVAYIGSGGEAQRTQRLSAHDIVTGAVRWRANESLGSPVVVESVGYSASPVGTVAAVDLATGAVRWRSSFEGNVRAPAVAGGIVYLTADGERRIVALDRSTGSRLWSFDMDSANECCIAVARGLILVGTSAGQVYAIGGDGATLTPLPASNAPGSPTASPTSTGSPTATPAPLDTSVLWAVNSGAEDFTPWGLAQAPDGRLWTTEGGSDRISIFTADGEFVESWGTSGSGDGEFDLTRANGDPYGMVAFAPDGSFYVLDAGNRRIQRFDSQRSFVSTWGSFGTDLGELSDPVGLAVDADGNVHVLDDIRAVIETYDADGTVVRTIPAFPPGIARGAMANGLSIGPNGHFYVTAIKPNQVIELDRDGTLVATYGAPGSGAGAFNEQPFATAFDADGRMYVSQGPTRGDRPGVLVFDVDGTYLGGFGPLGAGGAELGFPWGVVVADDGIYVSDVGGLEGVGYRSLIRKFERIRFP
jgi:outer membrane protein assembly factor BamB